jgi:6-pyruvoyltetrahydropterin/6-carboxytetrahydropterin synthase
MTVHLHRRYHFAASHRLHAASLTDEQNRQTYGKCNNPFGHGHNYAMEITVSGPVDSATGMVMNLAELDDLVNKEIVGRFDHANLNLQPDFVKIVPTTENLTVRVYELLRQRFPNVKLQQVKVEETSNNTFHYAGKEEVPISIAS